MAHKDGSQTRRWAGLACAVVLLALGLILLGGQVAATEDTPSPSPLTAYRAAPTVHDLADPYIRLEKNDGYYGAAGVVVTRVTSFFFDSDEAWTRYQAGQLDTITPPDSALEAIRASPVYGPQLAVFPGSVTQSYAFSNDIPPCNDPLLRGALASAIDRQALINDVLDGDQLPALTLTPPRQIGHVDGYATGIGRPHDPALALSLLNASGYSGDPPITLMVNTNSQHQAIAAAVRQMWIDTLAITASVEDLEWGEYLELLRSGSAEERPCVFRMGWGADYPDADNWHGILMMDWLGPLSRYDNPAYDALVEAAAGETVASKRLELYEQVEATLVMTDTAVVPLYHNVHRRLTRPDLARTFRSFGGQHVDEWSFSGDPRPLEVAWGRVATLDPAVTWAVDYQDQLFLGLTYYDEDTGDPLPQLATGWQFSSDATIFTFTLRTDATWTDGRPVTAGDVEYGVLRSLDPATRSDTAWVLHIIENAREYNEGQITDPDQVGVEALDASHIRFTLERPAAYFPAIVALPAARPQPRWAIEAHGLGWLDPAHIVTNGPYKLIHWDQAPYLRIRKWGFGEPLAGAGFWFDIEYLNDGGAAAGNCVISETLLSGMTYISDTSGLPHTGTGTAADPIVWQAGAIDPYSAHLFELHVQVTAAPGETIRNRVQIATGDPNDQGASWEKESEWQGHVHGPWMYVNYARDSVGGVYPPGHTFSITVKDSGGTVKATASANTTPGAVGSHEGAGPDGNFNDGFNVDGNDWSPASPDIKPDDRVEFLSDDGYSNTVRVGAITGVGDADADTVAGTIRAPWFTEPLQVFAGNWGFTFGADWADPDGGTYLIDFDSDLKPGQTSGVCYVEPDRDRVYTDFDVPCQVFVPLVLKNRAP